MFNTAHLSRSPTTIRVLTPPGTYHRQMCSQTPSGGDSSFGVRHGPGLALSAHFKSRTCFGEPRLARPPIPVKVRIYRKKGNLLEVDHPSPRAPWNRALRFSSWPMRLKSSLAKGIRQHCPPYPAFATGKETPPPPGGTLRSIKRDLLTHAGTGPLGKPEGTSGLPAGTHRGSAHRCQVCLFRLS